MAFEEVARQFAHLSQESQITLLRAQAGFRTLEHFDQSDRLQVGLQNAEHQEEVGRIGGRRFARHRLDVAGTGPRRDQNFRAVGHDLVQQPAVLRLMLLIFAEPGFLDVDLVLKGQMTLGIDRPDGSARRRQGRHHAGEKLPVKFLRRNVALRQLGNLRHQRADLLFGLFDQRWVERLFNAHIMLFTRFLSHSQG